MCGIGGYWGNFDSDLAENLLNRIAHRGPDDSGHWADRENALELVHARLSIIDLSPTGHQPMVDATGSCVIVYNGELYNYRELRKNLESDGYGFQGTSDTEVVLNLYCRDGVDMLSALNGIFAFAIWNKAERTLFLARDAFGVKPIYYSMTSKGFVFASEMKAVLEEATVGKEIDLEAVQNYLTYLWCPAPRTPLRSVKKFEPGQAMMLRDRRIERLWYFDDTHYTGPVSEMREDDAATLVYEKVKMAVERQMVADVPVGAFLSGGLDSSAVVAMARKARQGDPFSCFTIDAGTQGEGFAQDLPYARKVAEWLGVDLHVIKAEPDMVRRLPAMIYYLDEPQADPAPLHVWQISKLARANGIKVLLSGAGGDDVFTGYRRHRALMLERWWGWIPDAIRPLLKQITGCLPRGVPVGRRIAKAFQYAELNGDERLVSYFYWLDPGNTANLFKPDHRSTLNGGSPKQALLKSLTRLPEDVEPLNKMLYLERQHFLADHNLNYTDKMSMAAGVEVRVPLLDPDLVATAGTLPPRLKQCGETSKWIFKKSMESALPKEIIYRPKTGFGSPLRQWMHHEFRSMTDTFLEKNCIDQRGLFHYPTVRDLIEADRTGRIDATYTIFGLVCFEIWCRLFIDGDSHESIIM